MYIIFFTILLSVDDIDQFICYICCFVKYIMKFLSLNFDCNIIFFIQKYLGKRKKLYSIKYYNTNNNIIYLLFLICFTQYFYFNILVHQKNSSRHHRL